MKPDSSLTEADVASVFRALADEHAEKLEASEGRRTFQRIQSALALRQAQVARTHGFAARLPARRVALLTLAPAFAAAALTLGVTSWLEPGPLSFEVQGAENRDGVIEAGATPVVLSFSDESKVVARPRSILSMSLVGEYGALARLQDGELNVKVTHADETDWRFLAGPYEVRVVGTEFDLGWNSESSKLSIVMHEGQVSVVGPHKTGTMLRAGDSATFGGVREEQALASGHGAPGDSAPGEDEGRAVAPEAGTSEGASAKAAASASVTRTGAVAHSAPAGLAPVAAPAVVAPAPGTKAPAAPSVSWAELVSEGQFAEVVSDAERIGIETALATRGSGELQALAQASQYTGKSSLALKTYGKVRQRFAAQRSGRQAAFFMGRIYDQQGNTSSALRWLDTYLAEAGGDVYASEALGRKLTLVQRTGSQAQARKVARQYLARFPRGAYAKTARDLLEH